MTGDALSTTTGPLSLDQRLEMSVPRAGRAALVRGCTAYELRYHPEDVAADLIALGVPLLHA
jgi:hypothetical protein